MIATINIKIYLPDSTSHSTSASKDTSIKTILANIDFKSELDYVVFTSTPDDKNHTPVVNLENTLKQLNMAYVGSYVAEISVFNKSDIHKYNKALYDIYSKNFAVSD